MCWGVQKCRTFLEVGTLFQDVAVKFFHLIRNHQVKEFGGKLSMWNKSAVAVWKLLFHTEFMPFPFRKGCRMLRLQSDAAPTIKISESLFQNCPQKGRSQVSAGLGSVGRTLTSEQMPFCMVLQTLGRARLLHLRLLHWPWKHWQGLAGVGENLIYSLKILGCEKYGFRLEFQCDDNTDGSIESSTSN